MLLDPSLRKILHSINSLLLASFCLSCTSNGGLATNSFQLPVSQTTKTNNDVSHQTTNNHPPNDALAYSPAVQQFINNVHRQHNIPRNALTQAFQQVSKHPPARKNKESLETKSWEVYRTFHLTRDAVNNGLRFWARNSELLNLMELRYGVAPEVLVAIIGIETNYGKRLDKSPIFHHLTHQTFSRAIAKREDLHRLETFLTMANENKLNPNQIRSSHQGGLGLAHFSLDDYRRFAIDYNGDGRKDLWNPVDAIPSLAKKLKTLGWRSSQDGIIAVKTISPAHESNLKNKHFSKKLPLKTLAKLGLRPAWATQENRYQPIRVQEFGKNIYWLTGQNFASLKQYRHNKHHALATDLLARALKKRKQSKYNNQQ